MIEAELPPRFSLASRWLTGRPRACRWGRRRRAAFLAELAEDLDRLGDRLAVSGSSPGEVVDWHRRADRLRELVRGRP